VLTRSSLCLSASDDRERVYGEHMYVRRLLPRWDELTRALGNEPNVLERFNISAERTLPVVHAGIPDANRLFALLMDQVPHARHLHCMSSEHFGPWCGNLREYLTHLV
jgi:hypothetical protein